MYSRERDMKKEVAFMKVIQISDFHLRGWEIIFPESRYNESLASDD